MRTPDESLRRASASSRLLVSLKSFPSGFKFCNNTAATRATDTTHRPAVRLHLESRFCTWKSVKDFSSVTTRHIVPDGCYTPLSKQLACQLQSTLSANAAADVPMPDATIILKNKSPRAKPRCKRRSWPASVQKILLRTHVHFARPRSQRLFYSCLQEST